MFFMQTWCRHHQITTLNIIDLPNWNDFRLVMAKPAATQRVTLVTLCKNMLHNKSYLPLYTQTQHKIYFYISLFLFDSVEIHFLARWASFCIFSAVNVFFFFMILPFLVFFSISYFSWHLRACIVNWRHVPWDTAFLQTGKCWLGNTKRSTAPSRRGQIGQLFCSPFEPEWSVLSVFKSHFLHLVV